MRRLLIFIGILLQFLHLPSHAQPPTQAILPPGFGYLILDLQLEKRISKINFKNSSKNKSANFSFGPFEPGRQLTLVKLPAGSYQLTEVSAPHYNLPFRVNYSKKERMRLTITENHTNYFAHISLGENRSTRALDIRIVNRLAVAITEFDEKMKNSIDKYPLRYAGLLTDHFYETFISTTETEKGE